MGPSLQFWSREAKVAHIIFARTLPKFLCLSEACDGTRTSFSFSVLLLFTFASLAPAQKIRKERKNEGRKKSVVDLFLERR